MEKTVLQEILQKIDKDIIILDSTKIDSFIMDREYFLDVFETRYEISLEINKPIKGLKETLDSFRASSDKEIKSTSINDSNFDIILYTDIHFNKVYGIVNFM
ncbi:hypothetical protein [Chryseobacterium defluvii]|uniref:Uncharacterized protein n=1 Tax=Chryseobacterium defluvii TaxID=160396 RepID=A0A495SD83_9FLAO|nr:hypothetical protein [Chryseobacterium defluvii]RKS97844.1 hypothetical protein BCF58_1977 [Chryseobacterium defluvii]